MAPWLQEAQVKLRACVHKDHLCGADADLGKSGMLCASNDIASCMPSEGWLLSTSVLYSYSSFCCGECPLLSSRYRCGFAPVAERQVPWRLLSITHSLVHPVSDTIHGLRSSFIGKLLSFRCSTGRLVLPNAMWVFIVLWGKQLFLPLLHFVYSTPNFNIKAVVGVVANPREACLALDVTGVLYVS